MKKIFQYIRDSIKELGFVTWPKRDVLIRDSLIVLAITFIFGAGFWLVDGGLRAVMNQYIAATEPFRGSGSTMSGTTLPTDSIPVELGDIQLDASTIGGQDVTVEPTTTTTEQ